MNADSFKKTSGTQDKGFEIAQGTAKVFLKATKVHVRKNGVNSGITGGGYQCC